MRGASASLVLLSMMRKTEGCGMGAVVWANVFVPDSPIAPIVSVDWLALSCLLPREYDDIPLTIPEGWTECICSPTAVWSRRSVFFNSAGEKICTLLAVPRSGIIDSRRAVLEIANRWLYTDSLLDICDKCLSIKHLSVTGINRVDLCGDFEMTAFQWSTFWKLAAGEAYLKGMRRGTKWWFTMDGFRLPHQLAWGGKDSVFKWKVYYKWKEIEDAPADERKNYILDMWRQAGMREKYVWRCEVSISDAHTLDFVEGEIADGFEKWIVDRGRIWQGLVHDKFVIRAEEGHTDRRHDAVLPFFSFDKDVKVRHGEGGYRDSVSTPERRIALKLWRELKEADVRANEGLYSLVYGAVSELMGSADVCAMLARSERLPVSEFVHAFCTTHKKGVRATV